MPSISWVDPDAPKTRTIIPLYFDSIIKPKNTLVNYGISTDTSQTGIPQNLFKNAWITHTDSSSQKLTGDSNQVNFNINRYFKINNHELVDTSFTQLIKVRDIENPEIAMAEDTNIMYSPNIDLSTLKRVEFVSDNSNLPVKLNWETSSTQNPDSFNKDHYNYSIKLKVTAKDVTGNDTFATREINIIKPNTLKFSYFPSDTTVNKDTSVANTGKPIAKDTLLSWNTMHFSYKDVDLGDGIYNRMWTAKGNLQGDEINRTQVIKDKSIGLEEKLQKDETPAYPNPTSDRATAVFNTNYSGTGRVELWGMQGQKLKDKQINVNSGENSVSVDLSKYSKGMYLFRIFDKNNKLIEDNRLIKQ
ncbi:MAG: T9SS type A sorting domain-containing protein, partial [Nanoarchaeota archaeon]|nr:T9SS type A sorting domain-containing protein [Nanoarchaeota archaeon]